MAKKPAATKKPAQKPKRRSRRRIRGALSMIGGLMIASAILRLAVGAGEAIAKEDPKPAPLTQPSQIAATPLEQDGEIPEGELTPLLAALKDRETRIKKREKDIKIRMKALSVAEGEINKKLKQLEQAEDSLKATMALAQTAAEDDLTRLTDVYASMKPKQAAALFEEMDPQFAAGFLGRMPAQAAASIMAGLTAQKAYTISVVLAGRNAEAPTQ